jgi:hypothetical protein
LWIFETACAEIPGMDSRAILPLSLPAWVWEKVGKKLLLMPWDDDMVEAARWVFALLTKSAARLSVRLQQNMSIISVSTGPVAVLAIISDHLFVPVGNGGNALRQPIQGLAS